MWDMLVKYRPRRTILLITQCMLEADYLADQIAIMVDGRIECNGPPTFLKNTVVKEPNQSEAT